MLAGDATGMFEQLASEETATCVRDYLRDEAKKDPPPDAEIGNITIGEQSFPSVGENSRAYQVVMEIKADGPSHDAYVDLVFIQKERAVAVAIFVDVFSPFDTDLKVQLAKKIAS